jgi:hypothetical protein
MFKLAGQYSVTAKTTISITAGCFSVAALSVFVLYCFRLWPIKRRHDRAEKMAGRAWPGSQKQRS